MQIRSFTGQLVEIGKYPYCVQIRNIPQYRCEDGLMAHVYSSKSYPDTVTPRVMFIQDRDTPETKHLLVLRDDKQLSSLKDSIKHGKIIYDSRSK